MNTHTTLPVTEASAPAARRSLRMRRDRQRRTRARRARHPARHPPRHGLRRLVGHSRPAARSIIVAPHDPKPLLAQLAERGPLTVTYLDEGPDAWRLKLTRA